MILRDWLSLSAVGEWGSVHLVEGEGRGNRAAPWVYDLAVAWLYHEMGWHYSSGAANTFGTIVIAWKVFPVPRMLTEMSLIKSIFVLLDMPRHSEITMTTMQGLFRCGWLPCSLKECPVTVGTRTKYGTKHGSNIYGTWA